MTEETIFVEALEKTSPGERAAYLEAACAGDLDLLSRVQTLLRAHEQSGDLLDPPVQDPRPGPEHAGDITADQRMPTEMPIAEGPGCRIGPYLITRKIGEGGMGSVFLADQDHPVRRSVAVKVIKPGMDSALVIARLEAERQALALMDHPHIARFLDAGTTASGRPFFVMEPVYGIPITEYCDQNRLTPKERLELFVPVCHGIQHAHQKGIIHRDIKPTNVLVTLQDGKPVPKVIDFGIAKAIDRPLAERTLFTQLGVIVGTPEYMSPEQARLTDLDVDTRSDIYSLGVLLYELLTGSTPLRRPSVRAVAFAEVLRRIREEEPQKPSTRLSMIGETASIAAQYGTEPPRLGKLVRGDLDWIVMKALEKDPARRYATANGLARDIQRHLLGDPVEAGPPSAMYRLRKLAGKHRAALVTAMAFAAMLVVGTVVSTWQAVRATRAEVKARSDRDAAIAARKSETEARRRAEDAERAARTEAEKARAVNRFLTEDLLSQAEPEYNAADSKVTLLEVLDRAAEKVADRFGDQPEVEDAVRRTIAGTYHGLGVFDKSERHWRSVAELEQRRSGPDSAAAWGALAEAGHTRYHLGQFSEALDLLSKARDALVRLRGADHPQTLVVMAYLASAYREAGRFTEAIPLFEEVLRHRKASPERDDLEVISAMANLALAYQDVGRFAEAIPLLEEAIRFDKARRGPDHPFTLTSMNNLALAYQTANRLPEAISLFEEVLQRRKSRLGPDHPSTLTAMNNLAGAYRTAGRPKDAVPLFEEVYGLMKAKLGPDHPHTLVALNNIGVCYLDTRQLDRALPVFEQAARQMKAKLGPDHPHTLSAVFNIARVHQSAGRLPDALPLLEEVSRRMEAGLGPDHPNTLVVKLTLAQTYRDTGRLHQALPLLEEVSRQMKAKLGPDHPYTSKAALMLALTYRDTGRLDQALPLLEEIFNRRKSKLGGDHLETRLAECQLVSAYLAAHRWADAEAAARECLEFASRTQPGDWLHFHAMSQLGAALVGLKRFADAEPLLIRGFEELRAREAVIPASSRKTLADAAARIVAMYEACGDVDQASAWKAKLGQADLPAAVFAGP